MGSETFTLEEIDQLVDEYRDRCLWFLRRDFYPTTLEGRLRVLGYIEATAIAAASRERPRPVNGSYGVPEES